MAEWEKLIPRPTSGFLRIKCAKCGNEQVIFTSVSNKVNCNVCGTLLAEPAGGKAKFKGEVVAAFE